MKWISVDDRLPEIKDDSVLVFFQESDSVEMVHVEDYFKDITSGLDGDGNQLYTKWYKSRYITHWMPLPDKP